MNRLQAFLLVFVLWAAIYLPGLGSTELKGEEGRRILPAITMLETGNWLVPYVGGKPFLRKPPLMNWVIAGSLRATGLRNEWTARLPTVLAMLALATVLIATARGGDWLKPETALVAAVIALTQAASLDKGRLAEIDALYASLTGIALVLWLAWWSERRSPWLLWIVPCIFLGLAALAKGPLHLLFFYAIVVAVLWHAKEWRLLFSPAHLAGLLVMGGIFGFWFFPYIHTEAALKTAEVWQGQFAGRVTGKFDWVAWVTEIPRGLADRLPWLLFAPLLWRRELPALGARPWALYRGLRLGTLATFFGLLLLPGILPRYTLPLTAAFGCLLAFALADDRLPPPAFSLRQWWRVNSALAALLLLLAIAAPVVLAVAARRDASLILGYSARSTARWLLWPLLASAAATSVGLVVLLRREKLARPALLASTTAGLVGGFMFLFAGAAVPLIARRDNVRPIAATLNAAVPLGERLCLFDPDYQPAIFYLTVPYFYARTAGEIPPGERWILARTERGQRLQRDRPELEIVRAIPESRPLLLLLRRE